MDNSEILILELLNKTGGCKLSWFIAYCFNCNSKVMASISLPIVISNLIQVGEILEVDYVEEDMSYRVKSLIFPKRTKIEIVEQGNETFVKAELLDRPDFNKLQIISLKSTIWVELQGGNEG